MLFLNGAFFLFALQFLNFLHKGRDEVVITFLFLEVFYFVITLVQFCLKFGVSLLYAFVLLFDLLHEGDLLVVEIENRSYIF